jgi:hypothetical protein
MIRKSGGALPAPKTIARHNLSFTYNQKNLSFTFTVDVSLVDQERMAL